MRNIALLPGLVALLLSACGNGGIEGTYRDELGVSEYRFDGDGAVNITAMGVVFNADYEERKDRVIVHGPHGTLVFRREDARLIGPMGLVLRPVAMSGKGEGE